MSHDLVDIRTELAASSRTRMEIGTHSVLHGFAGCVTLHLGRAVCAELATTSAKAMIGLTSSRGGAVPL